MVDYAMISCSCSYLLISAREEPVICLCIRMVVGGAKRSFVYSVMLPRPASKSLFQHTSHVGMASPLFMTATQGVVCLLHRRDGAHWNGRGEYCGSDGGNNTRGRDGRIELLVS